MSSNNNKRQKIINSNGMNSSSIEFAHPRWIQIWDKGLEPGEFFDILVSAPILIQYSKDGLIPIGKALVPGCGRGYDVTLLASPDRYVIGLDISKTAIDAAKKRAEDLVTGTYCKIVTAKYKDGTSEQQLLIDGVRYSLDPRYSEENDLYSPQLSFSYPEQIHFSTDSFFDLHRMAEEDKFDFIYDYTFLCALEPSTRVAWANKMAELIRTGGLLLTVIFPLNKLEEGGPPFSVNLDMFKELLEPVGFECIELRLLPSDMCHPGRDGGLSGSDWTTGVGRWQRK